MDIDPLDKLPVAMQITGLSRSSLYKLIAENKFPKQVKHGSASVWLRSELVAWVAARVAERDSAVVELPTGSESISTGNIFQDGTKTIVDNRSKK